MKRILTITLIIFLSHSQFLGQSITFTKHIVDEDFNGPAGIALSDINDDGYNDIICAGLDANSISCWFNNGEFPLIWDKYSVDDDVDGPIYISCGDIDGDNIKDIAAASWDGNQIIWYSNNGGQYPDFTKYIIKNEFTDAHEVLVVDLDEDGHNDIVGVSAGLNIISWFENDGNSPVGWTEHIIATDFEGARSVDAVDIDGDGDTDICGAALLDNEVAWWRNEGGNPIQWTKFIVSADFGQAHKVQLTDMDMDGNIDILGTAYSSGIKWWKNNGEDSISWTINNVSGNATMVIAYAVDLDNDSDKDIIASAQGSGYVAFYENTDVNSMNFDFNYLDNFPGAWPLHYGDINNDGYPDMVCGGNSSNEIRLYENDLTTMNQDIQIIQDDINVSPIPACNKIKCRIRSNSSFPVRVSIFDISGSMVKSDISVEQNNEVDISGLKNGVYTICGEFKDKVVRKKFIKY